MNDAVNERWSLLTYVGVGDAINGIIAKGRGTLMANVDVKSAHRKIPVHWLLGDVLEGRALCHDVVPHSLIWGIPQCLVPRPPSKRGCHLEEVHWQGCPKGATSKRSSMNWYRCHPTVDNIDLLMPPPTVQLASIPYLTPYACYLPTPRC